MKWDEGFYQSLVDNMSDGVYFVDLDRRVTYWNRGAERLSGYHADDVVGRRCREGMLNHIDTCGKRLCAGGCPLLASITDGGSHQGHMWMTHSDGYRTPVWVRTSPMFDDTGTIVGAVEVFTDDTANAHARARLTELEQLALADPLTGLGNRRYLMAQLSARHRRWQGEGEPYGVLYTDIDFFKKINDTYGHPAGDQTLTVVAQTLSHGVSEGTTVARFGGEEFVIIQPHATADSLTDTAERLRTMIASSRVVHSGRPIRVTASFGGALVGPADSPDEVLQRADASLYVAKSTGRDRVVVQSPPPDQEPSGQEPTPG